MSNYANYPESDLQKQIKPLSENGFFRFFQNIWRSYLSWWYGFSEKHPKLSKILYMVFFFIVFSEGVTIWQYIVMTFLPFAFRSLWTTPFVWPAVALPWTDAVGASLNYAIFNEPVKFYTNILGEDGKWTVEALLASTPEEVTTLSAIYKTYQNVDKSGALVGPELQSLQCAGLGNFIAFEIAVFTAQCINFPLQRNITYRSHGNPWYQAMWYFIGWVLISVAVNAVWGIINPLLQHWRWADALIGLIKTVITGGISMVIFFFIFLVIFPDNAKMAKNAKAKLEKLEASGASQEEIENARKKYEELQHKSDLTDTEKKEISAKSLASAKAIKYFATKKNAEKASAEEKDEYAKKVDQCFEEACKAIEDKEQAIEARKEVLARA